MRGMVALMTLASLGWAQAPAGRLFPSQADPEAGRRGQPGLREETSVDEQDGDRIAPAAGKLRFRIHVDHLPIAAHVPEEGVDPPPHFFAETAARPREEPQANQTSS